MHRKINCEAMKPTKKPCSAVQNDKQQQYRLTDYSTSSRQQQRLKLPDSINETHLEPNTQSPFIEHNLYSHEQELASSFSFSEDDMEFEYEKLLFSRFLQSNQQNWISFMHEMNKISQQKLLTFVKIGQNEKLIHHNRILSHYIGVWLKSMGYKDLQTKKRIVTNVQFLFPNEQQAVTQIASIMFDRLFQGYLPECLQLRILIELCKRGWEYLSFFLGRFIKILYKYKNVREQAFLEQVEKSIV